MIKLIIDWTLFRTKEKYIDEPTHEENKNKIATLWPKNSSEDHISSITKVTLGQLKKMFDDYYNDPSCTRKLKENITKYISSMFQRIATPTDDLIEAAKEIDALPGKTEEEKQREIAGKLRNYLRIHQERGFCCYLIKNKLAILKNETDKQEQAASATIKMF